MSQEDVGGSRPPSKEEALHWGNLEGHTKEVLRESSLEEQKVFTKW